MREVRLEGGCGPGRDAELLLADHQGQLPGRDVQHLDGAGRVRDGVRPLTRYQVPGPQLHRPALVGADQHRRRTARLAGPDPHDLVRLDDADLRAPVVVEERGDADAQRVGQPDRGAHAGVRTGLLDLDDHPAAHSRAGRQGVQGETALAAPPLEVPGERLGELFEIRHHSVQYFG